MSRFKDSWGKAKILLSQWLCIGAVFTACSDDEVVNQANKAPLQISVNAKVAKQSRTIVHGEWLPTGSSIGVSLFTPTGDDYDEQGYYNIQYKATGEEEDQVWSSMGVTPTISANEAALIAYYPYSNDEDLDLTAIPVEIATQTDYMFSSPLFGITNAAPKADIVLDHALTAIRVKLVLGDFTGDASVSEIAVASSGLGVSALMDIFTSNGAFKDIIGQGDKFTLPVDFELSTTGTDNDIMFVPDASVVSGVTTVSATIGGKKYTAGIEFDQAYKQGYIYTYTLTLNNSGFTVTKVNVNPWETGTDDDAVLEPDNNYEPDEYVVKVFIEKSNMLYRHNVKKIIGTVDWGDGTTETYTELTDLPEHTYTIAGNYIVKFKGSINTIESTAYGYGRDANYIKELVHIGDGLGINSIINGFDGQIYMDKIHSNAIKGLNVTNMESIFSGCIALSEIPEGLFDHCTEVTSFKSAFNFCVGLESIPVGLFDNNTKVTSFTQTFRGCTSLTSIPEGLFDNCPEVTSFDKTFGHEYFNEDDVVQLKHIPNNLFDNNRKVTNFNNTFQYSKLLTCESPYTIINIDGEDIKVHLYERANYPEYFATPDSEYSTVFNTFKGCEGLADYIFIPDAWK